MKKIIIGVLILAILPVIACGSEIREVEIIKEVPTGISQADYNRLVLELAQANNRIEDLEAELEWVRSDLAEPEPEPSPPEATPSPITITGFDAGTSPPFEIPTDEWIIEWEYTTNDPEMAVFGFFIYPRGETITYVEAVLFPEQTSGSTYSYADAGEYYIKVTAGNVESWKIIIKPL